MNIKKYTERARGSFKAPNRSPSAKAPAIYARTYLEGSSRRRGGALRRPHRQGRGALARRAPRYRTRTRQIAQGARRRSRATLSCAATARIFDNAEKIAQKAGDSYVTVERLLLALAMEKSTEAGKILERAGVTPQTLNAAIENLRKGRTADNPTAENAYDALKKYARDLTEAAARENSIR